MTDADIKAAVAAREQAAADERAALQRLADVLRTAHADGMGVFDLARLTGYSRVGIYNLLKR